MYAVVDIETTGGNAKSDRIIEIAVLLHDGEKITGEFSTLVQPERHLPYRISGITGISKQMLEGAPKFYEVARQVVEMTEGRTIVAHNARFDYQFLRNEFGSLGFDYTRDTLCTLQLARRLVPGKRSYKLSYLANTLGIEMKTHHRAKADAETCAKIMVELLRLKKGNPEVELLSDNRRLSPDAEMHKELIDQLPHETGVYYFYNKERDLIYIGKSVDIRGRILSHFSNDTTAKAVEMKQHIVHIDYELTGSELVALLKESEEIKRYKPRFNRAQRKSRFNYGLYAETDANGYLQFKTERIKENGPSPVAAFSSFKESKGYLYGMLEKYELCQSLTGLHRMSGPCFYHSIRKCAGACVGKESAEDYNARARKVISHVQYDKPNMLIVDVGREEGEKSLVCVENGIYLGYGFVETEFLDNDVSLLKACLESRMDNKDVRQIIKLYLRQEKPEAIRTWD